jgi:hypothetical protein
VWLVVNNGGRRLCRIYSYTSARDDPQTMVWAHRRHTIVYLSWQCFHFDQEKSALTAGDTIYDETLWETFTYFEYSTFRYVIVSFQVANASLFIGIINVDEQLIHCYVVLIVISSQVFFVEFKRVHFSIFLRILV